MPRAIRNAMLSLRDLLATAGPFVLLTLALLAAATLGGFLLGCPGALLNPSALIAGVSYEAAHVREGHGDVFVQTLPGFIHHIVVNLRWGLGIVLAVGVIVGVVMGIVRRRPADLLLFAFALPYYVLIGLAAVKFARYTLPLFPPLLLLAGALVVPRTDRPAAAAAARPWQLLLAIGGAYALLLSLALDSVMAQPDTRDRAAAFLREKGFASVGFATGPWFYSPPLGPLFAHPNPGAARESALAVESPRCIPAGAPETGPDGRTRVAPQDWPVGLLTTESPDATVLSELEYTDPLRLGKPDARAFLDAAKEMYPNREVFTKPVQVFGIPLANSSVGPDGLPAQPLPHDMLYTNPATVVLYE